MNKVERILITTGFLGVFMLIAMINISCGQSKIEKLDKLIGTYAEYGQFNGSVLVADKGEIIYKKGFGSANMEWNIPNQPDTKHRLGSITKQFTSMLIMQLVQQGKLKLDVSISTYLPDYPKQNGDIITIHHLLTHTSGTPNYTSFPNFFQDHGRDPYRPEELVSYFADSTLEFKPGERFSYSNSGYILLGAIIEKVTGKSYEQVLQENILTPLKMTNTGYDHHDILLKNRASGYDKNGRGYTNAGYLEMSIPYAAGALYSTVEDLYLWDQALYTDKLLSKNNKDLLFGKHIFEGQGHYAYGWIIGDLPIGNSVEKIPTISHSGGIHGFNTELTRFPTDKSFIVLLNNTSGAPLHEMTIAINGIIHDKPYDFPKKSIAYSLLDVIEKDGITTGLQYFEKVKDSKDFYLREGEINEVGYYFLQSNRATEGAAVFKINVEAYPNSFNVYDSYGEALMVQGKKPEAIENYKKSVQLNPGNVGGMKVLKEAGVNTDDLITKVPIEELKLLEGEYIEVNQAQWKLIFEEVNGVLVGDDKGYRYKLVPAGDGKFINPDDGVSLIFDTKDKNAITLLLFGNYRFNKVR